MRYEINNFEHLKQRLLECAGDDHTKPWSTYPCLEWDRGKMHGYGCVLVPNQGYKRVHRVSYDLTFGPVPEMYNVCHNCDNPLCLGPIHLFPGTTRDNAIDRDKKGRLNSRVGSLNNKAQIDENVALLIMQRCRTGESPTLIAADMGISRQIVYQIKYGFRWKHVFTGTTPSARKP